MRRIILLVTGGREFDNELTVETVLYELSTKYEVVLMIEGGAKGADALCKTWADNHDLPVRTVKPNWEKYGTRAGFVRNSQMVAIGRYEASTQGLGLMLVAFPGEVGTRHMIEQCEAAQIKVVLTHGKKPNLPARGTRQHRPIEKVERRA